MIVQMETGGTLIRIGIVTENGQRPEVTVLDPIMGPVAQRNRARRNVGRNIMPASLA